MLQAEIIAIGDEMISGARVDTNTAWLSQRLNDLGVAVHYHTTVGDTLEHNVDVFRIALRRADIVVATGGLGPTRDDLTREAIAAAVGRPLLLHEPSLEHIRALFATRRREMPPRNQVQAMFPVGATVIYNRNGTAPGIDLISDREDGTQARVFALPGVPAEMKAMFDEHVGPAILTSSPRKKFLRNAVMKFFGVGESDMEQRLGDMIDRTRVPRVGITVSAATISLRITAIADTASQCEEMIAATRNEILNRVGDLYFGDGEHFEQQHHVNQMLLAANEKLLVVELGNAAPLADWFAMLGQPTGYAGGVSLYSQDHLLRFSGESCLDAAAQELLRRFQADWMLCVDHYPAIDPQSETIITPHDVQISVHRSGQPTRVSRQAIGGHPSIVHARMAKTGLEFLRQTIQDIA